MLEGHWLFVNNHDKRKNSSSCFLQLISWSRGSPRSSRLIGLLVPKWVPFPKGYLIDLPVTSQAFISSLSFNLTSLPMESYLWALNLSSLLKSAHSKPCRLSACRPPKSGSVSKAIWKGNKSLFQHRNYHGIMALYEMLHFDVKVFHLSSMFQLFKCCCNQ